MAAAAAGYHMFGEKMRRGIISWLFGRDRTLSLQVSVLKDGAHGK
jgi:hypothetical protein